MLVVIGVVVVVALLAFPRYRAEHAAAPALAVNAPDVRSASPPTVVARPDVSPVPPIATPAPVDDAQPISSVKTTRRVDEKPNRAPEDSAARKSAGESSLPRVASSTTDTVASPVTASASPAPSTAEADALGSKEITITGCLENGDGERFRLTGTEGASVPTARSWRSGFLRKRPAPIELMGLALTARQYVGQRVSATGPVERREMQVRSLRPAGGACHS